MGWRGVASQACQQVPEGRRRSVSPARGGRYLSSHVSRQARLEALSPQDEPEARAGSVCGACSAAAVCSGVRCAAAGRVLSAAGSGKKRRGRQCAAAGGAQRQRAQQQAVQRESAAQRVYAGTAVQG